MIDPKAFGEELAGIVKAQTAPLYERIATLEKRLADTPMPENGKDGENGQDGKDGESVTIDDVLPSLQEQVQEYLNSIPVPENGKDGADGPDGQDGKDGADGEKGADGVGLAGAFINREGELTVTLTNGETKTLGAIVGKDGASGADGADGIGFEDMDIVHDGERGFTFRFQRGAKIVERSFTLPVMIDRGVFSEGKEYTTGDVVSFGGSMWVAQKETTERPATGDGWRLSVKKGRDGKDGELKAAPEHKTVKVK